MFRIRRFEKQKESEPISALCGKCGRVLVETIPSYYTTTTVYKKYFCPYCNDYPLSITYIYKFYKEGDE